MKIRKYNVNDKSKLVDMFAHNLETYKDYISHGEIQMGISYDGFNLVSDFKQKWERYLERNDNDPKSFIYVCEDNLTLTGFVIFGIEDDYDKEYGVIYDILLTDDCKGKGIGSKLFQTAIDKLKLEGICDCYLESGVNNHNAHLFFEKKGFKHISNLYRLDKI
jgi:GNAT superfamily N-acetyltransferase